MALIACSECGRDVSDIASTCPGCGAPVISEKKKTIVKDVVQRLRHAQERRIAGIFFFGGVLYCVFSAWIGEKGNALARSFKWGMYAIGIGFFMYIVSEFERNMYERKQRKMNPPHPEPPKPSKGTE